jgi:nucleoside-diphosphate-sugar epimerase
MKIYLTGSSGFLGKIIFNTLSKDNIVKTIGRKDSDIQFDLTKKPIKLDSCDLFIHAAGLAHFKPRNKDDENLFFDVNVYGTINLLNSLIENPPKSFVFISSVSVYGIENGLQINENHTTIPKDPYGLSKLKAEELIQEWCIKNNVIYTILRLPLVIGDNSKGNLEKLIKAIKYGYFFNISNGASKKSMVLAEDIASTIIKCSQIGGIYNLTDGCHPSFKDFTELIAKQLNKKPPINLPPFLVIFFAKLGDIIPFPFNSKILIKIQSNLTFDDSLARKRFNWNPKSVLNTYKI